MIEASRIIVGGDKTFKNCKIFSKDEQLQKNVPNIFEDDQFFFIDELGEEYFLPDYSVTYVEFNLPDLVKKAFDKNIVCKVKRIGISDITYSPAWVIMNKNYSKIPELPIIYEGLIQFTFIGSDEVLRVTNDPNVTIIQV